MVDITNLGFDTVDLADAVERGDVRFQVHPEFPELKIYNYTEEVQYRNRWNKITLACRGLVLNHDTHEIVARPWEKFFNLGQRDNRIESTAPVEVTDKMDGSLGILYQRPDGKFAIATRGSFASEQAIHATQLLETKYSEFLTNLEVVFNNKIDCTLLFEIVYPDNRIVVNYGDMDDLILLGGVNKEYGYYFGPNTMKSVYIWPGPTTQAWQYDRFVDAISMPERPGMEGIVIRSGTNMVKLKQADYVELHRIVTNLSPKTIWESMSQGKTVSQICAEIPDEFHGYVEQIGKQLQDQFVNIHMEAIVDYQDIMWAIKDKPTRKRFAELATQRKNPGLLFQLYDERSLTETLWKMIKPRGDVKSLVKDEG